MRAVIRCVVALCTIAMCSTSMRAVIRYAVAPRAALGSTVACRAAHISASRGIFARGISLIWAIRLRQVFSASVPRRRSALLHRRALSVLPALLCAPCRLPILIFLFLFFALLGRAVGAALRHTSVGMPHGLSAVLPAGRLSIPFSARSGCAVYTVNTGRRALGQSARLGHCAAEHPARLGRCGAVSRIILPRTAFRICALRLSPTLRGSGRLLLSMSASMSHTPLRLRCVIRCALGQLYYSRAVVQRRSALVPLGSFSEIEYLSSVQFCSLPPQVYGHILPVSLQRCALRSSAVCCRSGILISLYFSLY